MLASPTCPLLAEEAEGVEGRHSDYFAINYFHIKSDIPSLRHLGKD